MLIQNETYRRECAPYVTCMEAFSKPLATANGKLSPCNTTQSQARFNAAIVGDGDMNNDFFWRKQGFVIEHVS